MAGVKYSKKRVNHIIFSRFILTRITIFLLIVTGTLPLPKPFDGGTPFVPSHIKKPGPVDPNNFIWDQVFKFIMKSQGTPVNDFFKESNDSFEEYQNQPVSNAFSTALEDKANDDTHYKTLNGTDKWSINEGTNGTKLNKGNMQVDKILNDTLLLKWNNVTTVTTVTQSWWSVCQVPIIVTITGVVGVLLVTLIVVLWFKRQMRKGDKDEDVEDVDDSIDENQEDQPMTGNSPSNPRHGPEEEERVCQAEIELKDYAGGIVQDDPPAWQHEKVTELMTKSDKDEDKKPEGMKLKAKGLLERRGSFAGLTIDLTHNTFDNKLSLVTPPEESADEYLLSAANMLTRAQLSASLKNVQALHSEFWEIPLNHPERSEVALSGTKNRYETIMPNERTRVILDIVSENPLDSYINANYIRGYGGEEKAYIATQGPLCNTIQDFYQMAWNDKCPAIVMITKFVEKAKMKCESYFPMQVSESIKYGDYEVTVSSVTPKEGYTVRELIVKKNKESRLMLHFWYDTWPDHKTPDDAQTILAMATEIEKFRATLKNAAFPYDAEKYSIGYGPIVVHCSAGIGRTGCFIATCMGMTQLKKENKVDILGIVCQMRYDRGGMIQTAEQYEFVHKALAVFAQSLPGSSTN